VLVLPGLHLGVKPTHVGAFEIHQVAFVVGHGVWLVDLREKVVGRNEW
jgi:hypothetical protein